MKKITKRLLSTLMAAVVTASGMSAAAVSAYAAESGLDYSVSDGEMTIVVDVSQGTPVYVDTSNMEVVDLRPNTRSVGLPYSDSVTFDGTLSAVYSPVFIIGSSWNANSQLKLSASNFTGPKKVDAFLFFHQVGDDDTYYRLNNLGICDFSVYPYIKIILNGTAASSVDKAYLVFFENSNCATAFNYSVYM